MERRAHVKQMHHNQNTTSRQPKGPRSKLQQLTVLERSVRTSLGVRGGGAILFSLYSNTISIMPAYDVEQNAIFSITLKWTFAWFYPI